jgi:hypothetical protein
MLSICGPFLNSRALELFRIHGADEIANYGNCAGGFDRLRLEQHLAAVISSHTIQDGTYLLPYETSQTAVDRMIRRPMVFAAC